MELVTNMAAADDSVIKQIPPILTGMQKWPQKSIQTDITDK